MSKFSNVSNRVETVTLYEEYRLIEKDESEISAAWRGVHLLMFFLAFVFGSFCTFCFHMLMYFFDEKCVLFPKLISIKEMGKSNSGVASNKLLYDYISAKDPDALPVDFVSTHWVEKSTCYLPTYAPLLSGICGLIWTTMFVMCSSGSRSLTGLQRAWRILPTVFVFSLAMGGLSMYTSFITQAGLEELCIKLGEFTGSKTCSYTINVATLAYERRIRGVYQATRLTIMSAWLHTFCWIGAALTALLRIVFVVDFRLVKVQVDLRGNIEKMLERHEKHIRTDEFLNKDDLKSLRRMSATSVKVRFMNKGFGTEPQSPESVKPPTKASISNDNNSFSSLYYSTLEPFDSSTSLHPELSRKLSKRSVALHVSEKYRFIVQLLNNVVDIIGPEHSIAPVEVTESDVNLVRQRGEGNIIQALASNQSSSSETDESAVNVEEAAQVAQKFRNRLGRLSQIDLISPSIETLALNECIIRLKNAVVQTDTAKKTTLSQVVQISDTSVQTLIPSDSTELSKTVQIEELSSLLNYLKFLIQSLIKNEDLICIPTATPSAQQQVHTITDMLSEHENVEDGQQKDHPGPSKTD